MPRPLLSVSHSYSLIQIVDINSHTEWQTMQIQVSWLLQKPTDLDLHCLQWQGISGFSRTRGKVTYLKNVKRHIRGLSYGSFSMGHPLRISTVRRNWMCSGSLSFSMCMNISIKSSLLTARSSTSVLQVTVALLRAPCISANSCNTVHRLII